MTSPLGKFSYSSDQTAQSERTSQLVRSSTSLDLDRRVSVASEWPRARARASSPELTHLRGKVTIIVGTSSAGKSTLIRAMKELDPRLYESGGDMMLDREFVARLKTHAGAQYEVLRGLLIQRDGDRDILNHLFAPKEASAHFKAGITDQEQLQAQAAAAELDLVLEREIFKKEPIDEISLVVQDVLSANERGLNAVFDLTNFEAFETHRLFQEMLGKGGYKVVLAYCSLSTLIEHIEKRNSNALREGLGTEIRLGYHFLHQFSKLFGRIEEGASKPLDHLDRRQVISGFERIYKTIEAIKMKVFDEEHLPKVEEGSLSSEEYASLRKKIESELHASYEDNLAQFLKDVGFKDGEASIAIAPKRETQDYITIDTGAIAARENAARLV